MPAQSIAPRRKRGEVARRTRPQGVIVSREVEVLSVNRVHGAAVAAAVAKRLHCSTAAAKRRMERAREILNVLPECAREEGLVEWLRLWSARYDVSRAVGSGITFSLAALRSGFVADKDEDLAKIAFLAEDTDENLETLRRKKVREIIAAQQELVMIEEELERRRQVKGAIAPVRSTPKSTH